MLTTFRSIIFAAASASVIFTSIPAFAGDGYKDIKFGTSQEQLKKMNKCSLKRSSTEDGVTYWSCADLMIAGKASNAAFYFINNQLKRIILIVSTSTMKFANNLDFETTFLALKEKYGENYDGLTAEVLKAFDNGDRDDIQISWPIENIILRFERNIGVIVTYSSGDYEKLLSKARAEKIKNDL